MRYGKAESNVYIQGNVEAAEHRERAVIQRAEVPFSWAYSVKWSGERRPNLREDGKTLVGVVNGEES